MIEFGSCLLLPLHFISTIRCGDKWTRVARQATPQAALLICCILLRSHTGTPFTSAIYKPRFFIINFFLPCEVHSGAVSVSISFKSVTVTNGKNNKINANVVNLFMWIVFQCLYPKFGQSLERKRLNIANKEGSKWGRMNVLHAS